MLSEIIIRGSQPIATDSHYRPFHRPSASVGSLGVEVIAVGAIKSENQPNSFTGFELGCFSEVSRKILNPTLYSLYRCVVA